MFLNKIGGHSSYFSGSNKIPQQGKMDSKKGRVKDGCLNALMFHSLKAVLTKAVEDSTLS